MHIYRLFNINFAEANFISIIILLIPKTKILESNIFTNLMALCPLGIKFLTSVFYRKYNVLKFKIKCIENKYIYYLTVIQSCWQLVVQAERGWFYAKKRSRKYRIKIFRLRLCFRENRLWIFARYACTLWRGDILNQLSSILKKSQVASNWKKRLL